MNLKLNLKKIVLCLVLTTGYVAPLFSQSIPVITSWIINTTNATGYGGILSNVQTDQFDSTDVYISCTCIPGYSVGPWNSDPNIPSNQNFVFKITRSPQKNTSTPVAVGLGQVGVWSNGVAIYNSSDGMSYNNDNTWHRNAYYFEGVSFDNCLGHPDAHGCYHHHVNPTCLYNDSNKTQHSPIIGYGFDGYPVYGAYGYANPNGSGGIKRMRSSYQLRTKMVNRDTLPDGTILTSANYGPVVSTTYPLGDFMEDYQYISGSGDLDTNNGRYCVTPEYPSGTYAYFVTIDSTYKPVYPYVFGLTYYGVVQAGNTGPSGGHNVPPSGTKIYVPATSGINEIANTIKYSIEPNPVSEFAYIYFDPASDNNIKATLYNTQGQLLKTYLNWHTSIAYAIDMTGYPSGIYFLHFDTDKNHVVQKIVKMQ